MMEEVESFCCFVCGAYWTVKVEWRKRLLLGWRQPGPKGEKILASSEEYGSREKQCSDLQSLHSFSASEWF